MGVSQNGWTQLSQSQCTTFVINGSTAWLHDANVATVLGHVATRKNNEVERCTFSSSWRSTSYSGGIGSASNHTSATAFDDGAGGRHPYERDVLAAGRRYYSGFTATQEANLIQICAQTTDNSGRSVVQWGGDGRGGFASPYRDSMHFEIRRGTTVQQVAEAAAKIRGGSAPKPAPSVAGGYKYEALAVDGKLGPATIRNLQRWAGGTTVDGQWGTNTEHAIQLRRGLVPGPWGPISVKSLQRAFGAYQDGILGPQTWMAVQKWFNAHRNG